MSLQAEQLEREALNADVLATEVNALAEEYLPFLHEHRQGLARTPLDEIWVDTPDLDGYRLLVKNEGVQPRGSYKIRGATVAIDAAKKEAELRGEKLTHVVAASNGNHGENVAFAAQKAGLNAVVEMTKYVKPKRRDRVRQAGASVNYYHDNFESAVRTAKHTDEFCGQAYIPPFDSKYTMAGQGSVGLEIQEYLQEMHEVGEVDMQHDEIVALYPVGGGGLAAGCASVHAAARRRGELGDNFTVLGVQMEGVDAAARARYGRESLTTETLDTSCQSTALLETGELTQTILNDERYVADILVVTKLEVGEAMMLMEKWYGYTEPAGALSLAGALKLARMRGKPETERPPVMITVRSGGDNVSSEIYDDYVVPAQRAAYERLSAAQVDRTGEPLQELLEQSRAEVRKPMGQACLRGEVLRSYPEVR